MIKIKQKGNFDKIEKSLMRIKKRQYLQSLDKYGREGVIALSASTPVDSGHTASSWDYQIVQTAQGLKIQWINHNIVKGVPIAIILQYGHGTRNGGYVQGRDYINPAVQPIFDRMTNEMWKEVTK